MDTSLETYNVVRLNHEEINWAVTNKEIESEIKNLTTKKSPGLDDFTGDFFQIFI